MAIVFETDRVLNVKRLGLLGGTVIVRFGGALLYLYRTYPNFRRESYLQKPLERFMQRKRFQYLLGTIKWLALQKLGNQTRSVWITLKHHVFIFLVERRYYNNPILFLSEINNLTGCGTEIFVWLRDFLFSQNARWICKTVKSAPRLIVVRLQSLTNKLLGLTCIRAIPVNIK